MKREALTELHNIASIANLPSILLHGILSHQRADKIQHYSVAKQEVQELRAIKTVPGGRPLHHYANLYICARNPMLFVRKDLHESLCVIRVHTDVLDLPGVVVSDQNAASPHARFGAAPGALAMVDREQVFAQYWTHEDPIEYWRHKSVKCAEVLVPDRVAPDFILGAYASCDAGRLAIQRAAPGLSVQIDSALFFR